MKQVKKMGWVFTLFTFVLIAQSAVNYDGNRIAKKPGVVLTSSSVYSGGLLQQVSSPQLAGYLDQSFNGTGMVRVPRFGGGTDDQCYDLAIQSDGKFVLAGFILNAGANRYAAVRLLPNGLLDTSFGGSGTGSIVVPLMRAGNDDEAQTVKLQDDGKIVMAGFSYDGGELYSAVRLTTAGVLDETFGPNHDGTVVLDPFVGGNRDQAYALCIQSDGKLLLAGKSVVGGNVCLSAARLNTDGTPDITFGTSGDGSVVIPHFGIYADDVAYAAQLQADGKIVLAGRGCDVFDAPTISQYVVARLNIDGTTDNTFGPNGNGTLALPNFGGANNDQCLALQIQSDGKLVLAGVSDVGAGILCYSAVRLNANGTLDATFGNGGHVIIPPFGEHGADTAYALFIQIDGKLLLSGHSKNIVNQYCYSAARLHIDGSLDKTFGPSGQGTLVIPVFSTFADSSYAVQLQSDGKIVLAGFSYQDQNYFSAVRLTNQYSVSTYQKEYPMQGGFY